MKQTKTFPRLREDGGGALVEFVVLMLVFVPLILLPMYFQDALRFKLDTQEAVYSTAWDFAYANYQESSVSSISDDVEPANQDIFNNLWSGDDRSKSDPAGPWADFSWNQKIECSRNSDFGTDDYPMLAKDFRDEYGKGGLVTCSGSISVANHYIPKFFLQESDPGGMAEQNFFDPGTEQIDYPEYKFGVMVDPWCIHDTQDVTKAGNGNEPFYDRVEQVWKKDTAAITYNIFRVAWLAFAALMMDDIANPTVLFMYDNPTKLKLTAKHPLDTENSLGSVGLGGRSQFYVSPYEDGEDDKFKETYENRGDYYLGCESFGDNCN